ncbi:PadR family transcriptional regulator [Sciscionella sediminilitoris]|uniref:PadR family transcriptional regulator n=1 Tax=Sciscionella sediminilitoris TaxID=1445613 RepID=UPI000566A27B|nr:PadR family transcriptional regulator [Sciscionella sp. SE31]
MQRSGLALAVLALLFERPMHPYLMQQHIKERGKDLVVNVGQRSQLYKTIDRLQAEKLVRVAKVERSAAGQERTLYEITDEGRKLTVTWTYDMLASPRRDFPEFTAGLAYLPVLTTDQTIGALEKRLSAVRAEAGELEKGMAEADFLPRLFVIESEYMLAHLRTDIEWIEALLAELRAGTFTWDLAQLEDWAKEAFPEAFEKEAPEG